MNAYDHASVPFLFARSNTNLVAGLLKDSGSKKPYTYVRLVKVFDRQFKICFVYPVSCRILKSVPVSPQIISGMESFPGEAKRK